MKKLEYLEDVAYLRNALYYDDWNTNDGEPINFTCEFLNVRKLEEGKTSVGIFGYDCEDDEDNQKLSLYAVRVYPISFDDFMANFVSLPNVFKYERDGVDCVNISINVNYPEPAKAVK